MVEEKKKSVLQKRLSDFKSLIQLSSVNMQYYMECETWKKL